MSDELVPKSDPIPEEGQGAEAPSEAPPSVATSPEPAAEPVAVPASEPAQEALFELEAPEPTVAVVEEAETGPLDEPEPADAPSEPAPVAASDTEPDPEPAAPEAAAEAVPSEPEAATAAAGPEPTGAAARAPEPASVPVEDRFWSRTPFFVLGAGWLGGVAALTFLMWDGVSASVVGNPLYAYLVFGGAGLVLLGFVTGLTVWLSARARVREDERAGVARKVWLRAVAWTAGGVAIWWVGIILLDLHRAGLI